MKTILLSLAFLLPCGALAQTAAAPSAAVSPSQAQADVQQAIYGDWTGILEYRDYKEPPTSTKRVQLPTWLRISPAPEGIFFDYTYDDGPDKTVLSHNVVVLDFPKAQYRVVGTDAVAASLTVQGIDTLRKGRGELMLSGTITENGKPTELRRTWTIRRNLISWTDEVRPVGSTEPFVFRHRYLFTRAAAPKPAPSR